jgi:hypothetical protein
MKTGNILVEKFENFLIVCGKLSARIGRTLTGRRFSAIFTDETLKQPN